MFSRFLSYVEIKTKITSIFAFLLSLSYLFSVGQAIDVGRTAIFFAAMFLFDLTTTAINNYVDTGNSGAPLQFGRKAALAIIILLFIVSAGLGILLAAVTDIVVLLLGGACFLFGVLYSYGPVPISGQPWGEFFSGLFYGLFIPFLILYINMPAGTYFTYTLSFETIDLSLRVTPILTILLLSVAPFCVTANIMLANNTCDVERDIAVKRHTLPYYIGHKALYLFAGLYYLTYLSIIAMVVLRMLSPICLLSLVTIVPVQKNIQKFFAKQEKSETFILSIQNYVLIMAANCLVIFASGFFR